MREAVAGYRQPTHVNELDGAWQLLEAAGIDVQIEIIKEIAVIGTRLKEHYLQGCE